MNLEDKIYIVKMIFVSTYIMLSVFLIP